MQNIFPDFLKYFYRGQTPAAAFPSLMLPHPMLRERGEILDDEDDEVVKIEKLSEP